jgi:hypothetical protein
MELLRDQGRFQVIALVEQHGHGTLGDHVRVRQADLLAVQGDLAQAQVGARAGRQDHAEACRLPWPGELVLVVGGVRQQDLDRHPLPPGSVQGLELRVTQP